MFRLLNMMDLKQQPYDVASVQPRGTRLISRRVDAYDYFVLACIVTSCEQELSELLLYVVPRPHDCRIS